MKGNLWAQALKYITIGLFVLLPLVFSYNTMDPVLVPRWLTAATTLSALLVILFLFLSSKKQTLVAPGSKLFWIGILGFLIVSLSSIFYATNPNEAFFTSLKWFTYLSFLFLFIQLFKYKVFDVDTGLKTILFSGGIVAIVALFQKIGGQVFVTSSLENGVHGGLANPNLLGSFCLILFPVAMYSVKLFKNRYLAYGFMGLFLLAAFFSESRTAYVGIIIQMLLAIFLILKGIDAYKKWVTRIFAFTVVFVAGALLAYYFIDRYHFFALFSGNTLKTRFILGAQSLEMVKEFPLFGVGSGNWKIFLAKYGLHHLPEAFQSGSKNYVRPHNDFVWVFAENGLLGGFFYLLFWIGSFISVWQFRKQQNILGNTYLIILIGFLAASMLDYPSERNMHMLFFMFLISIPVALTGHEKNEIKIPNFIIPILLIGSLFSSYVASQRMEGEKLSAIVQQAYLRQDGKTINRAFNDFNVSYYDLDPTSTPLYFFKAMGSVANNNPKQAIKEFDKALEAHPWHLISLNNLGAMYKADKQYEKALSCYNKAVEVANTYKLSALNKVEALLLNNNVVEGTQEFRQLDLDKKDPIYKYFYDLVKEKQISYVFERYPELKSDTDYVKSILAERTYDKMFVASEKKDVPLHVYLLPYPPGEAPPPKN